MSDSEIKVTVAFTDPELDPDEREDEAQRLFSELRELDDVDVARVIDVNPPEGHKSVGGFLSGLLTAEVRADQSKALFGLLGDRLGNKPIELSIEAHGKKISIKASSPEELAAAMKVANDFVTSDCVDNATSPSPSLFQSSPSSPQQRIKLFTLLSELPPAQFEALLFGFSVPPGNVGSSSAPQGNRVSEFLQWAASPVGCGLDIVEQTLAELIKPTNR